MEGLRVLTSALCTAVAVTDHFRDGHHARLRTPIPQNIAAAHLATAKLQTARVKRGILEKGLRA